MPYTPDRSASAFQASVAAAKERHRHRRVVLDNSPEGGHLSTPPRSGVGKFDQFAETVYQKKEKYRHLKFSEESPASSESARPVNMVVPHATQTSSIQQQVAVAKAKHAHKKFHDDLGVPAASTAQTTPTNPVAPIQHIDSAPAPTAPVPVAVAPTVPAAVPNAAPVVTQEHASQAKPSIWSQIKSAVGNFFAGFFGKKNATQEFSPKEFDKLDAKGRGDRLASYADTNATLLNAAVKHIVKSKLSVHFPPDVAKMEKVLKVVKQHMDESPLGTSFYGMHSLFQNLEKGIKATPNPQQNATESIDRTATPVSAI
ncbi:MAG: hypothetical protein WCW01_00460 [Gammaproteobacteria bacterium]